MVEGSGDGFKMSSAKTFSQHAKRSIRTINRLKTLLLIQVTFLVNHKISQHITYSYVPAIV